MSDIDKALRYCYNILAKKDYSILEIRKKLVDKLYSQEMIDETVSNLREHKYLDDIRLGSNILTFYSGKKGPLWIKQKLLMRKLKQADIENIMSQCNKDDDSINGDYFSLDGELSKFEKYLVSRFGVTNFKQNMDVKLFGKITRHIASRGFPNPVEIVTKLQNKMND